MLIQHYRAFWRTCSFMLGAALQRAFKQEANLQLHSFPGPNSEFYSQLSLNNN